MFQGDIVRRLKEEGKPKSEITEAVAKLKECKKKLEDQVNSNFNYVDMLQ